jgi:hypothetical protein
MQPTDILANLARLKSSPSDANFANNDAIFAGPAAGHVPTAWEQQTGDENADRAETAMGAGPAIDALRHAADEQRRQVVTNADAADADYRQHGMERARMHSNVANEIADIDSEAAAHRTYLPWAESAGNRDAGRAMAQTEARYLMPAQIAAQGNIMGHQAEAGGRLAAAQATAGSLPQRGLMDALTAIIEKTGRVPTPEEIANLRNTFMPSQGQ